MASKEQHPALAALTRRTHAAGNINLRPLSLGSYSICCRAGLRIVLGPEMSEKHDEFGKPIPLPMKPERQPFELSAFAFIHSADQEVVLDALDAGEKGFRRAVDAYALGLSINDFRELAEAVHMMVQDAFSALVTPVKSGESDDEFSEKNGRGRRESRP